MCRFPRGGRGRDGPEGDFALSRSLQRRGGVRVYSATPRTKRSNPRSRTAERWLIKSGPGVDTLRPPRHPVSGDDTDRYYKSNYAGKYGLGIGLYSLTHVCSTRLGGHPPASVRRPAARYAVLVARNRCPRCVDGPGTRQHMTVDVDTVCPSCSRPRSYFERHLCGGGHTPRRNGADAPHRGPCSLPVAVWERLVVGSATSRPVEPRGGERPPVIP